MAAAADCQLESIRRIQLLRAELEHSLRVSLSPPKEKRPLNILFRSDKSAQIQILGTEESALKSRPVAPTSSTRFTVSPTANAMPAMTDRAGGPKAMGRPLRVLIINNREPKAAENQQPRPAIAIVPSSTNNNNASATSPASSVDSGIVSPGGDFLFGCGTPGSPSAFPSWATIPRTSGVNRRRVFNFSNCAGSTGGSLIDALALSGKQPRAEHKMTDTSAGPIGAALLTLQKPPAGKKLQNGSLPMPTAGHHQHQQSQSSSSPSSVSSAIGNNSSSSNNSNINRCSAHAHPHPMQRQMSEGAAAPPFDDLDAARRARAATMPPLKSILKKPRTAAELMSQQQSQSWGGGGSSSDSSSTPLPRNHQRRMPTRMVLSRSISEDFSSTMCAKPTPQQPPTRPPMLDPLDEHFEEQIAAQMEKVIAEHQAAKLLSAASASPSACSTEGSEEASPVTKKRVSFSEQVHARIYRYRSNSSILGQRRKNEKKAKHRSNKRSNSDEQEESAAEEFSGNGIGGYKQSSPPICRGTGPESVFSSHMASNSVLAQ